MQHPYQEFVDTELWNTLWETVDELVENQDIEEMTSREYIVGYVNKITNKDSTKKNITCAV